MKTTKRIKVFFCRSRVDEEKSGFGIICVDSANGIWISHFLSKKLRDSLITTTVISALRSQKEDLRLVYYTWFGKLIMGLWEQNKNNIHPKLERTYEELIKDKSIDIKNLVDDVFHKNTEEITKLLEGAIAHKEVSFKFINDTKNELYKNVQLFVNDGIDRPLHEKGTGIQSAIIISLFSLYCNEFHNNSSLLITEEPELFLHPQARRVISAELNKFISNIEGQRRQLIISTHSTEYLRNVEPYNIVRVYKDAERNCSIAKQLDEETSHHITAELKRFLWSNNTELFFADKVILVEGGEVYLLPSIVDSLRGTKQLLDYENITVSRVNGKGNFLTYVKMLQCFDISFVILGDLDCFDEEVPKLVKYLKIENIDEDIEKIKKGLASMQINYEEVSSRIKNIGKNFDAQTIHNLLEKFVNGEIERDNEDLLSTIKYMQSRYKKGNCVEAILSVMSQEEFKNTCTTLRNNNIFIWSKGELEYYYSDEVKKKPGTKDTKALELSYLLQADQKIEDYLIHLDEIKLLVGLILKKE